MRRRTLLTDGPVGRTLIELAGPMLIGIAAIFLFNIVDTFWVGQLGARDLAAMSFTFPVTMVVTSLSMGVGIGTTAVIARALGGGDRAAVRRLTTDALALAVVLVTVVAAIGLSTIDPLFAALGADEGLRPRIREYMTIWYGGVGLLVIPMVGNAAIRATGDTRSPSVVMMVAGLVNLGLDPLLIFGIGPFPRLELRGAALATVVSYLAALGAALWILARREKMLAFERPPLALVLDSWRRILRIGLPAATTQLLAPLSSGVLTRMVAGHGIEPVAGFGVGGRLEALSLIGVMALTSASTPFIAQNLGAGRHDRIREAVGIATRLVLGWGLASALGLALAAPALADVFADGPAVIEAAVRFLRTVPLSYPLLGLAMMSGGMFNALDRPLAASALMVLRLVVLAVPLAALGDLWLGLPGLFGGIAAANLLVGAVAITSLRRHVRSLGGAERPAGTAT
jgi:putative MATE family efflux protein